MGPQLRAVDLARLNTAPADEARERFLECCAARAWADAMAAARPFPDVAAVTSTADRVWWNLEERDWLEAFAAHPRIGEQAAGRNRFARWSRSEQADSADADRSIAAALAAANREYEDRFGHVFVVFATGKTAAEMLDLCRTRLGNDPEAEIRAAAAEQAKITDLRLRKLLGIG